LTYIKPQHMGNWHSAPHFEKWRNESWHQHSIWIWN
jgi:hypothetical protein